MRSARTLPASFALIIALERGVMRIKKYDHDFSRRHFLQTMGGGF
jgi:hypothetical protein